LRDCGGGGSDGGTKHVASDAAGSGELNAVIVGTMWVPETTARLNLKLLVRNSPKNKSTFFNVLLKKIKLKKFKGLLKKSVEASDEINNWTGDCDVVNGKESGYGALVR